MDEKKDKPQDETRAQSTGKEKKGKGAVAQWFDGIMGEFKRITWPGRNELVKITVTVIVTSGIFGGIIVLYDFLLNMGYNALLRLIN